MSFINIESSRESGRPVALYEFVLNTITWRYTSADAPIVANGNTYEPAAITDDGEKQTGETLNDALTINAPTWVGPAQVFMSGSPSRNVAVTKLVKHESNAETRVVFKGEITQVNYPLPGQCRITCETLASTMKREGLRIGWQRTCPYSLYDPLTCKVDKAAWGMAFTITGLNGRSATISLSTVPATGHFDNGFIEWTHPIRGAEFVPVETWTNTAGVGTAVFLTDPVDLFVGATGTIYPGCNFTPTNCQQFGNYDNYGGIPDLPGKSPFDGTPVF